MFGDDSVYARLRRAGPSLQPTVTSGRKWLFVWVFFGYAAGAGAAWWLIDQSDLSAVLFPPAGITVAALIMSARRDWWIVYLAAGTAELLINATIGNTPFSSSLGFVAANLIEPTVAVLVLTAITPKATAREDIEPGPVPVRPPSVDLARRPGLARFLAAAVVTGPAVGATIGAAVATVGLGAEFVDVWPKWWLGDALGVTLIGSAILVWRATPDARRPSHPAAIGVLAISAALTVGIITTTDLPVLFVVLVGIILAGAQFGVRTVALLGLIIAGIVAVAFAQNPDGLITNLDPDSALIVIKLQLLLFVAAGFVVAAEANERSVAAAQAAAEQQTVEALHRLLLPPTHLSGPNFTATGFYQAAATHLGIGGDWYDVITLPDQRILITVGDIVGHNDDAARTMSQIRALLPVIASTARGPDEILDALDSYTKLRPDTFAATAWIGVYEPSDHTLTYTTAGHPPGYLKTQAGAIHQLDQSQSTPLGVRTDKPRPTATITIAGPATLVLYTDGLIERRRKPLSDGFARLESLLAMPDIDPGTLVADMLGNSDHQDDTVLLWTILK